MSEGRADPPFLNPGMEKKRTKFTASLGPVKHRVLQVNRELAPLFNIKEGDTNTQFGYFACDPATTACVPAFEVGVLPENGRTLNWSGGMDLPGTSIKHVGLKGTGFIEHSVYDPAGPVVPKVPRPDARADYMGLMSLADAKHDMKMAEQFAAWGIPVARGIAILELAEIDMPGEGITSVQELSKRPEYAQLEKFRPVIYVRGFGVPYRVNELSMVEEIAERNQTDRQQIQRQQRQMLTEAMRYIEQTRGMTEQLTAHQYLDWFAETLGTSIGKIHAKGITHGFVANGPEFPQNVTLAAELVDFDTAKKLSVVPSRREDQLTDDFSGGWKVMERLMGMHFDDPSIGPGEPVNDRVWSIFKKAYEREFPEGAEGK